MHLISLFLQNFRSYSKQTYQFSPATNLILGPNGSGKTNMLEAIQLLSTGTSFRSISLSKLIAWDQNFAIISAATGNQILEIQLTKKPNSPLVSRKFLVESVAKPRRQFLGQLKTVIFSPEDIRLTTGSPSRRRQFLDSVFLSLDWRYPQALSQYTRALKHRNQLLDQIAQGKNSPQELFYWDNSIVKNSQILHQFRQSFINSANSFFQRHPHLQIKLIRLAYSPSHLTPQTIKTNYHQDLARGYTSSGAHRDDFIFQQLSFPSADKNLAFWGSRGQQRLAVLALRLAQINFIQTVKKQNPILLLDDILSELDLNHQKLVINICQQHQTLVTSADPHTSKLFPQSANIKL